MTKKQAPSKRKRDVTPAQRKARSENMKRLHAEGRAGAEFGKLGGRPRKKRAGEYVAEGASTKRADILKVFEDAIDEDQSIGIRMKGAEALLKVEREEGRLAMDEEEHFAKMTQDQLALWLGEKLASNPIARERLFNVLKSNLNGDGEAVDTEGREVVVEPSQIEAETSGD